MHTNDDKGMQGDVFAMALGCMLGLLGGAILGTGIVFLIGTFVSEVAVIVILHTSLAMMVMGAWCAPALLPPAEQKGSVAETREA